MSNLIEIDNTTLVGFDYTLVKDAAVAAQARQAATKIKRLVKDAMVEIGRELVAVKAALGHGHFDKWVEAECGYSKSSANKLMNVATNLGDKCVNITYLGTAVVQSVAAPSTPKTARDIIIARSTAGERLSRAEVEKVIIDAKMTPEQLQAKAEASRLRAAKDARNKASRDKADAKRQAEQERDDKERLASDSAYAGRIRGVVGEERIAELYRMRESKQANGYSGFQLFDRGWQYLIKEGYDLTTPATQFVDQATRIAELEAEVARLQQEKADLALGDAKEPAPVARVPMKNELPQAPREDWMTRRVVTNRIVMGETLMAAQILRACLPVHLHRHGPRPVPNQGCAKLIKAWKATDDVNRGWFLDAIFYDAYRESDEFVPANVELLTQFEQDLGELSKKYLAIDLFPISGGFNESDALGASADEGRIGI